MRPLSRRVFRKCRGSDQKVSGISSDRPTAFESSVNPSTLFKRGTRGAIWRDIPSGRPPSMARPYPLIYLAGAFVLVATIYSLSELHRASTDHTEGEDSRHRFATGQAAASMDRSCLLHAPPTPKSPSSAWTQAAGRAPSMPLPPPPPHGSCPPMPSHRMAHLHDLDPLHRFAMDQPWILAPS